MGVREVAAVLLMGLTIRPAPAAAQRTGDRARLVFTVSGAYIGGKGLWTVPNQPVQDVPPADTFSLRRGVRSTLGASFSGTYFPSAKVGLTAEAFLIGLGYEDGCDLVGSSQSAQIAQVCQSLDKKKSAAAVTLSVGGIFRVASREFISPFARIGVGLNFSNQSSLLMSGFSNDGVELLVYDDKKHTRVLPAASLGVGATAAFAKAYHMRWEVRDNIVGISAVTGPTAGAGLVPPHETRFKHLWSILIGFDVILERERGRRY
jgi:opacity protein-like surface antigen